MDSVHIDEDLSDFMWKNIAIHIPQIHQIQATFYIARSYFTLVLLFYFK